MIAQVLIERVEQLIHPFLEGMGADLVDLKIHRNGLTVNLQVLVDKVQGGISLAECSRLNREIVEAIERENLIEQHYVLEVSSPGIDRPLRTKKDFAMVISREVHFFLLEPVAEKIEHQGQVKEVREEHVVIDSPLGEIAIPLDKINKAKQII